jgi:NAD(P)-dependent dehydrogenase (short-subunit alcohol dehydrogenase family)
MAVQLWAARLAAHNIQVFEVRPGVIRTDMIEKVRDSYEEKARGGLLPQGRLGDPADVAAPIRAIADGKLDYGTGTVINADGGFHLRIL